MAKYKVWNLRAIVDDGSEHRLDHRLTITAEGDCCSGYSDLDDLRRQIEDHMQAWLPTTRSIVEVEFDHRPYATSVEVGVVQYTLGSVDRAYGGPEEGGWYYDAFTPERVFSVPARYAARARVLLDKYVECSNKGRRKYDDTMVGIRLGVVGRTPRPHYC